MENDFMTERIYTERKRLPHCPTCVCNEDVKVVSQMAMSRPKIKKMDRFHKRECHCGCDNTYRRNCSEDDWDQPALCRPTQTTKIERKIHTDHKYGTLENWFKRFDFDCNGLLDLFELRAMLNFLGAHTHPDYIQRWMDKADRDRDGFLSFPEFLLMWRQVALQDKELFGIMKEHDLYPDVLQVEDYRGRYPRKVTDIVKKKCNKRCGCEDTFTKSVWPKRDTIEAETRYFSRPTSQRDELPILSSYR